MGNLPAGIVGEDQLRQSVPVADVDEDQTAMVALSVDPPGKFDRPPDVGDAKLPASVSAIPC
jgi:hypothetical protein